MKKYILMFLLIVPINCFAESIEEKVARNAANCFIGHKAIASKVDKSKENLKYLELMTKLIGFKETEKLVFKTRDKLKFAIFALSSSKQVEGMALIKDYCPQIDEILKNDKL